MTEPHADPWATAAHDLRTPLTSIAGFAELLLHRDDEATRRQAAEQILAASARLEAGIDNVLTLLAMAHDDLVLDPAPLPLRPIVAEVCVQAANGDRAPLHVGGDGSPEVVADREQLRRMLKALLSVARRPASARAATSVGVEVEEGTAFGVVAIELGENGSRAADRLEVQVARRLAEAHGGSLTLVEEEGRARRLELALPLASRRARVGSRRVLIIDDDETIRSLLRITLSDALYEIAEASDGDEALELADSEAPDLVLLDWRLPGRSGADVLRALKERHPELPVVVVTAASDAEARATAAGLGAELFLSKPYSPIAVLEAVERLAA